VAKKETTDVTVVENMAVGMPVDYLEQLAKEAKAAAAVERPKVTKLSTSNGQLKYLGEPVAGNNMDVIILFASYRNVYYSGAYDRNNIKNPDCFALSASGIDMRPSDVPMDKQQNPTCEGCWANQWKSDKGPGGEVRKGKACKESRRLILMPAGVAEDVSAIKTAELAILDLPVTSAANYGGFVNAVAATVGVPPWACVANIKVQPSKNQFEVVLTPLRVLPSKDVIEGIRARLDDAERLGLEPYDETSEGNSAVIQAQKEAAQSASAKF
jgi:hypothetical protein